MWAGRHRFVGIRDVLLVPPDVRRSLAAPLPADQFTVYAVSKRHVAAVTHQQDGPYELYLSHSTARNRPEIAEGLAATRNCAAAALRGLLPPGADPSLPLCRDVWQTVGTRPFKQRAFDVLYDGEAGGEFPLLANVAVFSDAAVLARDFTAPLSVELNVPLMFQR